MTVTYKQYEMIQVVLIRDNRFSQSMPTFERHPMIGDKGTIVEIYTNPELGYEVECTNPINGHTIWLEAMYPEEVRKK